MSNNLRLAPMLTHLMTKPRKDELMRKLVAEHADIPFEKLKKIFDTVDQGIDEMDFAGRSKGGKKKARRAHLLGKKLQENVSKIYWHRQFPLTYFNEPYSQGTIDFITKEIQKRCPNIGATPGKARHAMRKAGIRSPRPKRTEI